MGTLRGARSAIILVRSSRRFLSHYQLSLHDFGHQRQQAAGTDVATEERIHVDINSVVTQLREELEHIERAIAALVGLGSEPARRGRPPKAKSSQPASRKRRMSAAARARIGAAKKAWWAKQKGKSAGNKAASPTKKSTRRRPMSPAMKKKLSRLMKARWAARKKAVANP